MPASFRPTTSPSAGSGAESWGHTPSPGPVTPVPVHGGPAPDIARGSLVVLRQFDVSEEVDLEKVQRLQSELQRRPLTRQRTALLLSNPPVAMPLGTRSLQLCGKEVQADLVAKVFDFGTISVRMTVRLSPGTTWSQASALVRAVEGDETLTRLAREEVGRLLTRIAPAVQGAHESALFEDYTVLMVEGFAGNASPSSVPLDALARLLLGEPDEARLSPAEVHETTRLRSSYYGNDLFVTGWNTALVVEPSGDTDKLDVVELANAQLLELRFYDELLDRELAALYDEVARRRGRRWLTLLRNYGPVMRRAMAVMLEIAEFIERVENSLKIIGDVYLARQYAATVESLRIPAWERSLTRKQKLVQQVYDVLKNEVDASRDQLLELTIVALIVGEIVLAMRVG